MIRWKQWSLALLLTAAPVFGGEFEVRKTGENYSLLYDGKVLLDTVAVRVLPDDVLPPGTQSSTSTLPDGAKVYELWNENPDTRFRREIALRPDGAVEITLAGEAPAFSENLTRLLRLTMPYSAVSGTEFEALAGNGRQYRPINGKFDAALPNGSLPQSPYRFLAVTADGKPLTFDFLPLGAGDYCTSYSTGAVRGVWQVARQDGILELSCGSTVPRNGGYTGTKVVIREGGFEDYDRLHALRSFAYGDHLKAEKLFSFGAQKFGKEYTAIDASAFDAARGAGWLGNPALKTEIGAPEGAYYAHIVGRDAKFKVTGLRDGWYIVSVGAGNYNGASNAFGVTVSGRTLAEKITVKPRTVTVASRAMRLTGGTAEFDFQGEFVLSTMGLQFLMADGEDFSVRRGFWVADGYEPGSIYRNADYRKPPVFPLALESFPLPEPGKEAEGAPKIIDTPTELPDPDSPAMAWVKDARMFKILGNSATLGELDAPGAPEKLLDQELAGKRYNAVMISGMHSRHTYFNHLDRGVAAIHRVAEAAHARNLKLIDHHDSTLLWNSDAGFRVLMERLPEMSRAIADQLPSFQFCPLNPQFKETYYKYLLELVKAGVDGFQIDELTFWEHGCGCGYCREQFFKDTGWQLPVNELDPRLGNTNSDLGKLWFDWRRKQIGNWFVELRRRAKEINPNLTLCMYTTHWGFTRSGPRYKEGTDLFELARAINYFGTEVMTRNVLQSSRPLVPFRKMKNALTTAFGTPVWGWIYASDWPTCYFAWAASNMVGQVALLPEDIDRPKNYGDFRTFDGSPDNMHRTRAKTVAPVALLFSAASRDWNSMTSFTGELFGIAQTLESMHVPYEFIAEMSLNEKQLAKYQVLVLASDGCLSDRDLAAIKTFARNGGTVYLSTVAGLCDEYGRLRKQWGFADVFGFTVNAAKTVKLARLAADAGGKDAVTPEKPLSAWTLTPAPATALLYGFTAQGQKLPLLVEKAYGKGKLFYQAASLGGAFCAPEVSPPKKWEFRIDEKLETLFRGELARIMAPGHYWTTDAPDQVFTAIWHDDDELLVHFLNATGANIKAGEEMVPTAPKVPYPPLAKDITFTLPGNYASAVAVSPDFDGRKPLVLKDNADGTTTVTLPKDLLKAYTIVRLK